jgi:drug/metabolite transporter (DMT)-like permease
VLQSLPIAVTLGAALVLGEQVGWRRRVAILAGFVGVLIILRPGSDGFSPYMLLGVLTVGLVVVRELSTRVLTASVPSSLVAFVNLLAIAIFAGLASIFETWKPVDGQNWVLILGAGALILIANFSMVRALRIGDVGFASPFRFSAMLWAALVGFLLFSEVPDLWTIAGSGIVIGAGLFTLYRETRRR